MGEAVEQGRGARVGAVPGVVLVGLAAALWGTDGLFRRGLALELPAATVVAWEHAILVLLVAPLLPRAWRAWRGLSGRDRLAVVVIGAGASALATTLFTASFRVGDPTTPLLLQKLQPLVAVGLAHLLLGERVTARFWWFLGGGLAGAWLIAFADPAAVTAPAALAGGLAAGAAALWALGTVLGRAVAVQVPFGELTALRFLFGLPAAIAIALLQGGPGSLAVGAGDVGPLVALALVPGLAGLLLYYRGLRSTPASAATVAELTFPLTAIALGAVVFGQALTPTQWLGAGLLMATITVMGLYGRSHEEALGVRVDEPALAR